MADLIIQVGHLSYWRHLIRMTCRPSPNLMGNVWHFDLNVMGPGIENNLCFTTTNVSRRLGNNRQADTIIGDEGWACIPHSWADYRSVAVQPLLKLHLSGVKMTLLGVRHVRIISITIPNYGMHPIIKGVCNEASSECKGRG